MEDGRSENKAVIVNLQKLCSYTEYWPFSVISFQVVPSGENNIEKDDEMEWMIMPEMVSLINALTIHWLQWMKYWYVIKYEWYMAGSFYHVISLPFLNKEANIMHILSCAAVEFLLL